MTAEPITQARLLTWNIWAHHGDWSTREQIVATALHTAGADIIALQETWIRHHQLAAIITHLEERRASPLPAVLCGDLNATPEADEIRALTGHTTLYAPGLVFQDA